MLTYFAGRLTGRGSKAGAIALRELEAIRELTKDESDRP
jgi:hypothetical protein